MLSPILFQSQAHIFSELRELRARMNPVVNEREIRLTGLPVSDGVALARVFVLDHHAHDSVPLYRISPEDCPAERARLEAALQQAAKELDLLVEQVTQRTGAAQANIFVAQKLMIQDPMLIEQIHSAIDTELLNVEAALDKTLDSYESVLLELDDEYLKERASDIGEIRRRLLEALRGGRDSSVGRRLKEVFDLQEPRIIVAQELSPSETVALDHGNMVGFLTERGGRASHAAILARALGIPAVSGVEKVHHMLAHGQEVLMNGATGEVVLWPSESTLHLYPTARSPRSARVQTVASIEGFTVMANISTADEADLVRKVDADGVGLYRTEFECLAAGRFLSEDEQYERYVCLAKALAGKPLQVRLLDLGGDKSAAFLGLPVEENPCMGFRGARLLQGRHDLLVPQVRALARASRVSAIDIIYPMIVDVDQFLKLRTQVAQAVADIDNAQLRHGVMFEVPSACLMAEEILEAADFGSIGSNDLIQYLFAVDRNNDKVAYDYTPDKPVFWRLIGEIAAAANVAGKPVSVCGEMGGQPQFLPKLYELGIRRVSVSPRLVGLARMAAKRLLK